MHGAALINALVLCEFLGTPLLEGVCNTIIGAGVQELNVLLVIHVSSSEQQEKAVRYL